MKKLILLLLLPLTSFAQINYSSAIDTFMKAQVKVNNFNGNVLVGKAGKIIYKHAFGYRNFNTKAKLDNNSIFELASVTKQFTAMGILMLIEKNQLKLTDSLRKFFPQLPYHNITIKNLLTHTSGLPDYMDAMQNKWDHKKIAFNNDMIAFLASDKTPPNFAPGKKWEYSNTAYAILASIIEKVSGLTYSQYLQKNVFKPLDMRRTRVYNTRRSLKDTIADYAYGFEYSDSLKRYVSPDSLKEYDVVYYLDGIMGDGTVNSTTADLYKWDRALKNHTLLNEKLQREMLSPQSIMDTLNKSAYGYGVEISKNNFGDFISHTGGWPGYFTVLTRYPAKDITIIVLSNNDSNAQNISDGLAGIMFGAPVELPYIHQEAAIDTTILNRYLGVYHNQMITLQIINKGGKLFRRKPNAPDIALIPETTTKFFYADKTDRQVEFEIDKNGNEVKCWFVNAGVKFELQKDSK